MPFKDFSDTQLTRIISQSEDVIDEVAMKSCPSIKSIAEKISHDLNMELHGWEIQEFNRKRVLDADNYIDERQLEKLPLHAPKTTKTVKSRLSRPHLLSELKTDETKIPKKQSQPKTDTKGTRNTQLPRKTSSSNTKKAVARKPRPEWNL